MRSSSKLVAKDAKRIVKREAYDTGAFAQSIGVRALKRSRKRIGVGIFVDRAKLFALLFKKKTGVKLGLKALKAGGLEEGEHYYPASIEFGWTQKDGTFHPPVKPMRRALYEN